MRFRAKLSTAFFLVTACVLVIVSALLYKDAVRSQMDRLRSTLMIVASLSASQLDGDAIKSLVPAREADDLIECRRLRQRLSALSATNEKIKDIYVMVKTPVPHVWKFLANGDTEEFVSCGTDFDVSTYPEMQKAFERPSADKKIQEDRWGAWLSGYAPVKDSKGEAVAIVGVDIGAETVYDLIRSIKLKVLYGFLIGMFLSVIIGSFISRRITQPLNELASAMLLAKNGDFSVRTRIDTKDEIQLLSETFNKMLSDLKNYVEQVRLATAEKERFQKELEIATQMQQSILPHIPAQTQGLDVAAICIPAKEVGGDFFDYLELGKHNLGFVIADASGKGLPGALLMTTSRSVFHAYAQESDDTGKVLEMSNKIISKDLSDTGKFITFFYALFDTQTQKLTYSNAGHNPPILIKGKDDSVVSLQPLAMPLGIMGDQKIDKAQVALEKGDIVVFYTDGVTEAQDSRKDMFGLEKLQEIIIRNKQRSAKEIIKIIKDDVWGFVKDAPQYDDFTLLVIKVEDGTRGLPRQEAAS